MSDLPIQPSINWPMVERSTLTPYMLVTHQELLGDVERALERTAALVLLQMASPRRTERVSDLVIGKWFAREFSCTVVIHGIDGGEANVTVMDGQGGTGELAHFMALGLTLILNKTLKAPLLQPSANWAP